MQELLSLGGPLSYAGLFLALILGAIGFPFPEDAILIGCGILISRGSIGAAPALLAVYSGVVVSDALLFTLARRYGPQIVTHRMFHHVLPRHRLDAIQARFDRFGTLLVFLGRHIFWLRAKIIIVAGMMKMSPWKFLAADAVSAMVSVPVMVSLGYAGVQGLSYMKNVLLQRWPVACAVVLILAGLLLFFWQFARRRSPELSAIRN
jgi:membrane protein DedA with SNARE-associated domain